jgi:hypothetical protein
MKRNLCFIFSIIIILIMQSCNDKNVILPAFRIGQKYQGGTIFYVDKTGLHGLIADTSSQEILEWGSIYQQTYATDVNEGTGKSNTTKIIETQNCVTNNYAACFCDNYYGGGYDDWYLPSLNEIKLMKDNLLEGNYDNYWTSSEYSRSTAYYYSNSYNYSPIYAKKSEKYNVLPIRAF